MKNLSLEFTVIYASIATLFTMSLGIAIATLVYGA
jgi:hypothetical protein